MLTKLITVRRAIWTPLGHLEPSLIATPKIICFQRRYQINRVTAALILLSRREIILNMPQGSVYNWESQNTEILARARSRNNQSVKDIVQYLSTIADFSKNGCFPTYNYYYLSGTRNNGLLITHMHRERQVRWQCIKWGWERSSQEVTPS